MNPIIEEISHELDALIEVIKAFEKYEYPVPRFLESQTSAVNGSSSHSLNSTEQTPPQLPNKREKNGKPAVPPRRRTSQRQQSVPSADRESDASSVKLLSPKSVIGGALNDELLTMFNASSISPATGRLRLPKKELKIKTGQGIASNQVRYVKVQLVAQYLTQEKVHRGKVTFMTYTVDNTTRSEERAIDTRESDEDINGGTESSDLKPKVTHTKGKVHILYDDLKAEKLDQVKESLGDYGLRIKCRLEQKYNFNLYDWRSDTHSIDESDESGQPDPIVYEKVLMYKKTLSPGADETDSWESDGNFLSELIN
jgi:hypothetical protein